MNKCINLEPTNESGAPLSMIKTRRATKTSATATRITITQPSPRHARKRSLLLIEADPLIEVKRSSSEPITATSSLSRKSQRSKKEATVRFASVPLQTHLMPPWTKDEVASSWYSKQDILAFRRQEATDVAILRVLIQTTTNIETLPQEPAVYRGLERLLSPQISSEISDRRKRCVMGVLVAQHRGCNIDLIARVSQNISDKSVEWALTFGSI